MPTSSSSASASTRNTISEEAWAAIEEFRTVLRARARADTPMLDRLRMVVGTDVATTEVDEIVEAEFGDLDLPAEVGATIDTAANHAREGRDREAAEHLEATFQSVCDEALPEEKDLGPGRTSRCVRHDGEYEDPPTVIERRHGE